MTERRLAILVTGGRAWTAQEPICRAIADLTAERLLENVWLIHGGARGADTIAGEAALRAGINVLPMPIPDAKWKRLGGAAGKLRNRLMVLVLRCLRWCGYESVVLAFPDEESRGTWHCVGVAKRAGFEVTVIKSDWVPR